MSTFDMSAGSNCQVSKVQFYLASLSPLGLGWVAAVLAVPILLVGAGGTGVSTFNFKTTCRTVAGGVPVWLVG